MEFAAFTSTIASQSAPDSGWPAELQALWFAKKGQWQEAHDIAQEIHSTMGSWIHAHLHLIEGDVGNAGYWYSRAGRPATRASGLAAEWEQIVQAVLRDMNNS